MKLLLKRSEVVFVLLVFLAGVAFRLAPRLSLDPQLLTFQADIWYRLCLAQYVIDNGHLPPFDIRYLAYGQVPLWYNPWSIYFFAILHWITHLDLPTICSRVMPFIEALSFIPTYFLCRELYNRRTAAIAVTLLVLSPSYIFWTGISTLQSFTVFLIPITILLWVWFLQKNFLLQNKWAHLAVIGIILAINFLIHLSVFTHVIILFLIHMGLVIEKKGHGRDFLYLVLTCLFALALTAPWWLPHNLFWWWTSVLTTSSGMTEGLRFLTEYGVSSAVIGHLSFVGLMLLIFWNRRAIPSYYFIPIFWALFPLVESHNEGMLNLISRPEWTWNNYMKPLESFRFYLFLTQPLAVCFALLVDRAAGFRVKKLVLILLSSILSVFLVCDMFFIYKLPERFQVSGLEMRDIRAAQWFREHSKPSDRILSEYYTAQMIAGICGGKALLGSMFPLKEVNIPHISVKQGNIVQRDIYSVYLSYDVQTIETVLQRYHCTHIYVSDRVISQIEYFIKAGYIVNSPGSPDTSLAVDLKIDKKKLLAVLSDLKHFRVVYQDGDVVIYEWLLSDGRIDIGKS